MRLACRTESLSTVLGHGQPTKCRSVGRGTTTIASDDRQADVDITTGSIGIWADIVGFLDQILSLLLVHPRKRDAQCHVQSEAAFRSGADADIRGDRGV